MASSTTSGYLLTAPEGTPGEWIPNSKGHRQRRRPGGIRPIGLGFRVPCFVISPYSRGVG